MAGPSVSTYKPQTAGDAQGYQASLAQTDSYDATKGTVSTTGGPILRDVRPEDTVQWHIDSIIADNSPLMERARATALDEQNARGTLNSSMAIQAGQTAVLDAALPIAQQDAATWETQGRDNQTWQNDILKFDTSAENDMERFNVGEENTARQANSAEANTTNRSNAGLLSRASEFTADAQNRRDEFNVGQVNEGQRFNANAQNQSAIVGFEQAAATQRQAMSDAARASIANADRASQEMLTQLELENRRTIQSSQAGSQLYSDFVANVGAIQRDPNMTEEAKSQAIENLRNVTQRGLDMAGAASEQNLGEYLDGLELGTVPSSDESNQVDSTPAPDNPDDRSSPNYNEGQGGQGVGGGGY